MSARDAIPVSATAAAAATAECTISRTMQGCGNQLIGASESAKTCKTHMPNVLPRILCVSE